MTVFSSITEKVSSFLNNKVIIHFPRNTSQQRLIVIEELIHSILLNINKLENALTDYKVVFTGSTLTNWITPLPIVNDRDIKFIFFSSEGHDKSVVFEKIYKIVRECLLEYLPEKERPFCKKLTNIGVLRDSNNFFKNMLIAAIQLRAENGNCPLELSMVFLDHNQPFLSHLSSFDSLFCPIQAFKEGLGSLAHRKFEIETRENESVEKVVAKIKQKIISSSKTDWNLDDVSYFELGRYLIWITDGCREPDAVLFPCFFEGSIKKNSLFQLWNNINKVVSEKRRMFPHYPFFLLANFLFHIPVEKASSWLQEESESFINILNKTPYAILLQTVLLSSKNNLKSNSLFLLSCHLPLLADRVVCVDHLGKKQIQCHFSPSENESFTIFVPIPSVNEELLPWLHTILTNGQSTKRLAKILSYLMNQMPKEKQYSFAKERFNEMIPYFEKHPLLWETYRMFFNEIINVQTWMFERLQKEDECFFQVLSWETDLFLCEMIRYLTPHLDQLSADFWKKIEPFIKMRASCNTPWKSLSIRLLMETTCPPRTVRLLCQISGVVQNGNLEVDLFQFPKLLGTEENRWIFRWKLAFLFENSSYLIPLLYEKLSEEKLQKLKSRFPQSDQLRPLFQSFVKSGQIDEAINLLNIIKAAYPLRDLLYWYAQFYHHTKLAKVEQFCLQAVHEALEKGANSWELYALFSNLPTALLVIEPTLSTTSSGLAGTANNHRLQALISLFENPNIASHIESFLVSPLTVQEKNNCLQNLLPRIEHLIHTSDLDNAYRLASSLPFLEAKENDISQLLINLYQSSVTDEQRIKAVILIDTLAPRLTHEIIENFKSPYLYKAKKSRISSSFPLHQWVVTLLSHVNKPEYRALLIDRLETFIAHSPDEALSLVQFCTSQGTEREKEKMALTCSRLSTHHASTAQQIFDCVVPNEWTSPWTLISIQQVWSLIKSGSQSIEFKKKFVFTILESIQDLLKAGELLTEMNPYIDEEMKTRFSTKFMQDIKTGIKEISLGRMHSLESILQDPFPPFLRNSPELYEQLIDAIIKFFKKVSVNEIENIISLLSNLPNHSSQILLKKRQTLIVLWIEKLNSPSHKPLKINAQIFINIADWLIEDQKELLENDIFHIAEELILLSLKSRHPNIAKNLLSALYQIEFPLQLKRINTHYLPLLKRLFDEDPSFVQEEQCIEQLAHHAANQLIDLDDSKVVKVIQNIFSSAASINSQSLESCFKILSPSLNGSSDSINRVVILKNYLTLIRTLSEKHLKKINPTLLDPVKEYLLQMRTRFTDKNLAECAFEVIDLYMKGSRNSLAKTWIKKWSLKLDHHTDDQNQIASFYHHHWTFLELVIKKYDLLIEEHQADAITQYIKAMSRSSDPLLLQFKKEWENICHFSRFGGVLLTKQLCELSFHLNPENDSEEHLLTLYTDCLSPLIDLSLKQTFSLDENHLLNLHAYFLSMKNRMPLSQSLYKCIQGLGIISTYHQKNECAKKCLKALIPPLNGETDDLQQISILSTYYELFITIVKKQSQSCVDVEDLQMLAQYLINIYPRFGESPEICHCSQNVIAICAECRQIDLVDSLMLNIHRKRMIQFYEEKRSINIERDIIIYVEYLILSNSNCARILNTEELEKIFKEHKIRQGESGISSLQELTYALLQGVRKIHEGGLATPHLFHAIVTVLLFLMKEETKISEPMLQLILYACHCPWIDFSFAKILEFILLLDMKERRWGKITVDGKPYNINLLPIFRQMMVNFQKSDFANAKVNWMHPVQLFIKFAYDMYRKSCYPDIFGKQQMIAFVEKIINEKVGWISSSLLVNIPLIELQELLKETKLSSTQKRQAEKILIKLSDKNVFVSFGEEQQIRDLLETVKSLPIDTSIKK